MIAKVAILGRPMKPLQYWSEGEIRIGDLVQVPLGTTRQYGCVVECDEGIKEGFKKVGQVISPDLFPSGLIEVCRYLAAQHLGFLGEALGLALPRDIVRPPRRKNVVNVPDEGRRLKMRGDESAIAEKLIASARPVLLHSSADYTGLLVQLARNAIEKGKEVLLLAPHEPAAERLQDRLKKFMPLTYYHSNLGQADRRIIWHGVRNDQFPVILGMRSAVLLPFTRLGLIVVFDEDYHTHRVRLHHLHYNTRDVAQFRAVSQGCPAILFSLAPSLEMSHKARTGRIVRIERKTTQKGKALIVDMRAERKGTILSTILRGEIDITLNRGGRVFLLLNRLGVSARMMCTDCGYVPSCSRCGIPLRLTSPHAPLTCNICNTDYPAPDRCPECKGGSWHMLSPGLETLRRELKTYFPQESLCEVSADRRPKEEEILTARIIFGSSASLEYLPAGIQLAAMLSWDTERSRAEFRSSEQAFRDIAYMRRILASTSGSRLLVQTFRTRDKLLRWALRGDYESFFTDEVRRRRELGYPPYHRLLLFTKTGKKKAWGVEKLTVGLARDGVELLGPYPAKTGQDRILVKLRRDLEPGDVIDAGTVLKSGWQVEVDPVNIL